MCPLTYYNLLQIKITVKYTFCYRNGIISACSDRLYDDGNADLRIVNRCKFRIVAQEAGLMRELPCVVLKLMSYALGVWPSFTELGVVDQ